MADRILVATQLWSNPNASQITSIPVNTARRNTPLPPSLQGSDPPAEHATYSTILHVENNANVLMRVLHGGLILELLLLSSTKAVPLRFVFPALIAPFPSLFLSNIDEFHVLVVTKLGSLYRLIVYIGSDGQLWVDQIGTNWCREHLIKSITGEVEGLVHAQGPYCVIIGFPTGSLLRFETDVVGDDTTNDKWTETIFQHSSFLTSLTSLLPSLHGGLPDGSAVISMATHPQPTDIGNIWTLSRDRTLRLWTAKSGYVAARSLPSFPTRIPSPASTSNGKQHILEADPQTLLRVFSLGSEDEASYLLAFMPTPSSSTFGGFFCLFKIEVDQFEEITKIECSPASPHCHLQDFLVSDGTLYVLWDKEGRSVVDHTSLNVQNLSNATSSWAWQSSTYASEAELTPAYLEELILSPGSVTEKFLEAIMRPGMFSATTLRIAVDRYREACLSLPGPAPPQLTTLYPTLCETIAAIVGCTVELRRDPLNGALQHANYWNALKRDWEGFIARCREIERSARWPLALGEDKKEGTLVVVERERVGMIVEEDLPLRLHRLLTSDIPLAQSYALFDIAWTLRSKCAQRTLLNLESRLEDIMHQEIAFSFADIIQDQVKRINLLDDLDEGLESWLSGRIISLSAADEPVRAVLDIVAGFNTEIKSEVDDTALLSDSSEYSAWCRGLTATYISASVNARYELCLALVTFLFFVSDSLSSWAPPLLEEIFAVFRGLATLRFVSRQPTDESNKNQRSVGDASGADEVIAQMRNMHVSGGRAESMPTYSLLYRLLPLSGTAHDIMTIAHRFLDGIGLLQSVSPAHATRSEVLFCERLRLLFYYDVAREYIAWLPRTPGVTYVLGRLWLDIGRVDDAAYLMEKLAGCFVSHEALSEEDRESLAGVLPGAELLDSEFAFYVQVAMLFKSHALVDLEVLFSRTAISVAPPGSDTTALWHAVIAGYTSMGLSDEAYMCLMATPHDNLKRECISHLVYKMCEEENVDKLISYNFASLAEEVEDALSFKVRNVDPRIQPSYAKILYAWHVSRGNYRSAAATMYQRARKLHDLIKMPQDFAELAEEELEAYIVSINALSLVDTRYAFITSQFTNQNRLEKPRKAASRIPEALYSLGKQDVEVTELKDINYEYALLSARIDLVRKDPTTLSTGEYTLPPPSLILRLAQSNRFTTAMVMARSLSLDMTDIFAHLAGQCLRLARDPDAVIQEDTSDWLLTDKVSSWSGSPADRGWRYLRQSLERFDGPDTDYRYSKITYETILAFESVSHPPPWLLQRLRDFHHEYLMRTCLQYGLLEDALEHTLSLIRKANAATGEHPRIMPATWLPYNLVDSVVATADAADDLSPRGCEALQQVRAEVLKRLERMRKTTRSAMLHDQ